jgi:hypothetical protein
MSNTDYHESKHELSEAVCNMHKALVSLTE